MENKIVQYQPNYITNARIDFSQVENDLKYYVIEAVQQHMTKDKQALFVQEDLFGNLVIRLDLKTLKLGKSNNYTYMVKQAKSLVDKKISYDYNRDTKSYEITTVLVSSIVYERNSGKLMLRITPEAVPALLWLGGGYTAYNKEIALSLQSTYSKRMYELCSRWKDKGFFRINLIEFRKMFCIEERYPQICELRANVLDIAKKQMDEKADLNFNYALKKENRSRAFNYLYVWIGGEAQSAKAKETAAAKNVVWTFLYNIPEYRNGNALEITNVLHDRNEAARAAERITRLKEDIKNGKVKKHGISQYVRTILEKEFNIPAELLGDDKKKKRKQTETEYVDEVTKQARAQILAEIQKNERAKAAPTKKEITDFFQPKGSGTERNDNGKTLGAILKGL